MSFELYNSLDFSEFILGLRYLKTEDLGLEPIQQGSLYQSVFISTRSLDSIVSISELLFY